MSYDLLVVVSGRLSVPDTHFSVDVGVIKFKFNSEDKISSLSTTSHPILITKMHTKYSIPGL